MTRVRPPVERRHPPRALMRWVNPVVRRLIRRGVGGRSLVLLQYTGRRTGRRYEVPAGALDIDGVACVFTDSGWRHNFSGGNTVGIIRRGRSTTARGVLVDDADAVTAVYMRLIDEHGPRWASRRLGIRINVDRPPMPDEVRSMVLGTGSSIVRLEDLDV